MIARGDRTNAERLVREAWRNDGMSEDTETAALDHVRRVADGGRPQGADGLAALRHRAGSRRHARRQAARFGPCRAGQGAHRGQQEILQPQGAARCGAAANCTATPATCSPGSSGCAAKRNSTRPHSSCWRCRKIRTACTISTNGGSSGACLARKMLDVGEHRTAYLIARDAALPVARHLQDRAGIHRGLDRAALPERSGGRRPAFRAHRRRQRQPDRAGARRLLAGPRGGSRGPHAGGPRRLRPRRRAIDQLLRPTGARQARPAAARIERRPGRPRPRDRAAGDRPRRAIAL